MTHVLIVGGGLTGGLLSCALAESGINITLIDQADPTVPFPKDGKSFALSRSSANILRKLGVWEKLSPITPIQKIHTSDGMLPSWVDYHAGEVNDGPLGYSMDSSLLKSEILKKVLSFKNIKVIAPACVIELERTPTHVILKTNSGNSYQAPLCIAADGGNSTLRQLAHISITQWTYDQTCIVCNMHHTLEHENQAFEHFLSSGPLAFIPRKGKESGIVWSIEKEKADVLLGLSEKEFTTEVQAVFGDALGTLTLSSKRWSYPLEVRLPKRIINDRIALVGDAAHVFHPVAGQGLNVGLRDVAVLVDVLREAFTLGLDLGSPTLLENYKRKRRLDILSMTLLTDGLVRVFSSQNPLLARARSLGFGLVKHVSPLRHAMIRHGMGLTGQTSSLAKD